MMRLSHSYPPMRELFYIKKKVFGIWHMLQVQNRVILRRYQYSYRASYIAAGGMTGENQTRMSQGKQQKTIAIPRPSASILLLSPDNQILLLQRVQSSSTFASAHVFPGGNLSAEQDGPVPDIHDNSRHRDGHVYRAAAIRECFEECGIILAKESNGSGRFLNVQGLEREKARRDVYENNLVFRDWVSSKGGEIDTSGLIPFTRWITPTHLPTRFTTQMYLYFLPISSNSHVDWTSGRSTMIPTPTSDGTEHIAANFMHISEALYMARLGKIVLYPPQFFLLYLLGQFIDDSHMSNSSKLQNERHRIMKFVQSGNPAWTEKCISPAQLARYSDGRTVLGLDKPGEELQNSNRSGDDQRVVLVDFQKGVPRRLDVANRKEVLINQRREEKL